MLMLGWFFPRSFSQAAVCCSLWFSHTETEEFEVLFMPWRLNPYLYISILWAIKLLLASFYLFFFLLSFVFTLFCGVFWGVSQSGLGNGLELFVVQRRALWGNSTEPHHQCFCTVQTHFPPKPVYTERKKNWLNKWIKNPNRQINYPVSL